MSLLSYIKPLIVIFKMAFLLKKNPKIYNYLARMQDAETPEIRITNVGEKISVEIGKRKEKGFSEEPLTLEEYNALYDALLELENKGYVRYKYGTRGDKRQENRPIFVFGPTSFLDLLLWFKKPRRKKEDK